MCKKHVKARSVPAISKNFPTEGETNEVGSEKWLQVPAEISPRELGQKKVGEARDAITIAFGTGLELHKFS